MNIAEHKIHLDVTLLTRSSPFVFVLDSNLEIRWASPAFERRLKELIGQSVAQVIKLSGSEESISEEWVLDHTDQELALLLEGDDTDLTTLLGRFVPHEGGILFLARPQILESAELSRFTFDDLPEDGALVDLLATRDELAASLKDASAAINSLRHINAEIESAQSTLVTTNAKLHDEITERERIEDDLRSVKKRQDKVLSIAVTGFFTVDQDQRIRAVNKEFTAITGFREDEVVGQKCLVLGGGTCRLKCPLITGQEEEGFQKRRCTVKNKDGRTLTILKSAELLRDGSGKITGAIESIMDVTELDAAREAAEEASRAKSEFVANMSHEIRTPMNGIVGMTELALGTKLTGEQREYLEMVRTSADALQLILNDILDFSKIEAGRLDMESIDFDLRDTLGDALRSLAVKAHEKGLELAYSVDKDVPENLVGDPGRLRQIVVNLVGNAVKFTNEGEVVVTVSSENHSEDSALLRFNVKDTGVGIPRERQDAIFGAFSQADTSTTRRFGGTGLGLTICKQLVKLKGGVIGLESEEGRGSDFHFTARYMLGQATRRPSLEAGSAMMQGLRVLVVDDNSTNRKILEELLSLWRMVPIVVESGEQALASLWKSVGAQETIDLALLDAMMPGMDGYALAERIQQSPELNNTKLIMLTSAGPEDDPERSKSVGIQRRLLKPIKQSELFNAITGVFCTDLSRGTRAPTRKSWQSTEGLSILLAEDNAINQQLSVRLLEKRGHSVVIADNGRKAVETLEAEPFDLVLMDIQMPEMDGYQATSAIRELEAQKGQHTPIVAMTAHAMKGDRERCLDAGMDDYISKPVTSKRLHEVINRVMEKFGQHDPAAVDETERHEVPVEDSTVFDADETMARVDGDQELFHEIVSIFLENSQQLLADIETAMSTGDALAISRAAHTCKGAVSNFGARPARDAALALEQAGAEGNLEAASTAWSCLEHEVSRLQRALESTCQEGAP